MPPIWQCLGTLVVAVGGGATSIQVETRVAANKHAAMHGTAPTTKLIEAKVEKPWIRCKQHLCSVCFVPDIVLKALQVINSFDLSSVMTQKLLIPSFGRWGISCTERLSNWTQFLSGAKVPLGVGKELRQSDSKSTL